MKRLRSPFPLALALLALLGACSKSKSTGDGGPEASVAPSPTASVELADAGPPQASVALPPPSAVTRTESATLAADPELAARLAVLLPHFGADAGAGGFAIQRLDLVGTRKATLVTRGDGSNPIVLVTDGSALLWTKEQPTWGILPPVERVTIAGHSALGVALVAWAPAVKVVVGRVWADDANAFGDFELLHLDGCDDVVAAYVPDQGIWTFAASPSGIVLQQLNENNVLQKGRSGVVIASPFRVPAPLALVATEDGALWLALWKTGATKASDMLEIRRYQKGKSTLPSPVTIEVPRATAPVARPALRREGTGVRLELPHGAIGSRAVAVAVDATGAITRLEK